MCDPPQESKKKHAIFSLGSGPTYLNYVKKRFFAKQTLTTFNNINIKPWRTLTFNKFDLFLTQFVNALALFPWMADRFGLFLTLHYQPFAKKLANSAVLEHARRTNGGHFVFSLVSLQSALMQFFFSFKIEKINTTEERCRSKWPTTGTWPTNGHTTVLLVHRLYDNQTNWIVFIHFIDRTFCGQTNFNLMRDM